MSNERMLLSRLLLAAGIMAVGAALKADATSANQLNENSIDVFSFNSGIPPQQSPDLDRCLNVAIVDQSNVAATFYFEAKQDQFYQTPPELESILAQSVEPVNLMMGTKKQVREFILTTYQDKSRDVNATPIYDGAKRPKILLAVKAQVQIEIDKLRRTAFHEAMHVLFYNTALDTFRDVPSVKNLWLKLELVKTRRLMDLLVGGQKLDSDLFNVVTERCYANSGGHPWSAPEELVVSTITVLHFFPESFIESVNNLDNPSRDLVVEAARAAVDSVFAVSVSQNAAEDIFSPKLLGFLGY